MTNLLKLGKKIFTVGVVATTIFWSLGVAALVPAVANAATETDCATLMAGDLVKTTVSPVIYAVNADKTKSYFPQGDVFKSWTADNKYSYKTISQACLSSLKSTTAVLPRPGTYLVKEAASDAVYMVLPGNKLAELSATAAAALYGTNYKAMPAKGGHTITMDDPSWTFYSQLQVGGFGVKLTETMPTEGALVKVASTYYVVGANKTLSEVTATGLTANRFQTKFAHTLTATTGFTMSATKLEAQDAVLTDRTQGAKGVTTTTTGPATVAGALTVSLAATTPAAKSVPNGTSVEFLTLNLAASNDNDVSVTGIKLSATGLGDYTHIDAVTVMNKGVRFGTSRDVDSNKVSQINFTSPLVVKKGTTETVVVKATILAAQVGHYALALNAAADVTANVTVGGSFPIVGNEQTGATVNTATLTISSNGTLADVKLGDVQGTVAKLKLANNNYEDVTLNSLMLKKDSTNSTIADTDFVNYTLTVDGVVVATAAAMTNRYVTFNLTSPVTILKNATKNFTVKADAVSGASKALNLILDNNADLVATGNYYKFPVQMAGTFTGDTLAILAGAVSIVKVNATVTKLNKSQTNVELGTFKVTVNSGKTTELSTLKLTVASTNDAGGTQIENFQVYLKNTNTVYDLTSSTGDGVYKNTSMGLVLNSGTTYEFVVRVDTKSTATNGDYTVSIADAAGGAMVLKETGNDTLVTDITPNSVSLNKVSVETSSLSFSKNALSAAYNAVVGSQDVEVLNFNIKASTASDVKVTSLEFRDASSTATKSVVSQFKLYKGADLVKTVSANDLATYKIAFNDLSELVKADQTNSYKLVASLVNDVNQNGNQLLFELSAYGAEETLKSTAVYDTTIDSNSDGVVATNAFRSSRLVTIRGYGYLDVAVDTTSFETTKYDTYNLAGTSGVPVATFKFKAGNEDVKVTQFKVDTSASMADSVSRISLYDGDTEVAYTTQIGTVSSTLDQDFTVSGQKYYTLKVNYLQIGQDKAGLANKTATWSVGAVTAEGVSSGYTLVAGASNTAGTIGYEVGTSHRTAVSKTAGVVAAKIGTVSLPTSYGSTALASKLYSGQSTNAAIVAVTLPAMNNTNSDGSAIKFAIGAMKFKIATSTTIASFTATLERIGGSATATSSSAIATGYTQFIGLSGTDFQITPNSSNAVTAYFLVKVTPTFTAAIAGDSAITVSLDGLNGTAATNNLAGAAFTWTDMDGTDSGSNSATAKYPLRLPGVTTVNGTTISN